MREKYILNRIRLIKKASNLIKSNRINERIEKSAEAFMQRNKTITKEKFKRYIKDIQIMVAQELSDKPKQESFRGYMYIGKAKDWNPTKWQKIESIPEPSRTK